MTTLSSERARLCQEGDLAAHATARLFDILHQDQKLYLVFEFVDLDLKKYMDSVGTSDGLGPMMVKVRRRRDAQKHGVV